MNLDCRKSQTQQQSVRVQLMTTTWDFIVRGIGTKKITPFCLAGISQVRIPTLSKTSQDIPSLAIETEFKVGHFLIVILQQPMRFQFELVRHHCKCFCQCVQIRVRCKLTSRSLSRLSMVLSVTVAPVTRSNVNNDQ